jgi:hypothetical protein
MSAQFPVWIYLNYVQMGLPLLEHVQWANVIIYLKLIILNLRYKKPNSINISICKWTSK